jgi:hypothetical protein
MLLWVIFALLLITTPVYLITGVVHDEGGDQLCLVVKPCPMIQVHFGGGEEGTWKHEHPGVKPPWWREGHYKVIRTATLAANWEWPYDLGYLFTLLGWPFLVFTIGRRFFTRSRFKPASVGA